MHGIYLANTLRALKLNQRPSNQKYNTINKEKPLNLRHFIK